MPKNAQYFTYIIPGNFMYNKASLYFLYGMLCTTVKITCKLEISFHWFIQWNVQYLL